MRLGKLSTILATVTTLVLGAPALEARDDLLVPSKDPFYQPPEGWKDKKPGTILRSRKTPNSLGVLFLKENVAGSYHLLYRTNDAQGNPSATVTTVIVPYKADFNKLVAYSVAQDSSSWDCSPSYVLQVSSNADGLVSQVENAVMSAALSQGWVVTTSDYEQSQAAFTNGWQSAHGVLDSIRATLQSEDVTGVKKDAKVQLTGYSGGSLASGWAAQLQPEYAPELSITGAAIGGVVPNITAVALKVNKGPFTGLVPPGILGHANVEPEFKKVIDGELKPEKADKFNKALNQCLIKDAATYAFEDWTDYFKSGDQVLYNPVIQKSMANNNMGKYTPKTDFLFYHSVGDEIAPFEEVNKLYNNWCGKGVNIHLNKELAAEHGIAAVTGVPLAISWLKDRFDGKPVENKCSQETQISNLLDKDARGVVGETVFNVLTGLLGKPIGKTTPIP